VGLLGVLVLAMISLRCWRRRDFYTTMVVLVIFSMVGTPLVQGEVSQAFAATQEAAQQEQQQVADQQAVQDQALASLMDPSIDPHVGLLSPTPLTSSPILGSQSAVMASSSDDDGTDSDGDGLSDVGEEDWDACPSASSTDEDCTGVSDTTDSDGDGLLDGQEVNSIGTMPADWDSDGDSITDTLEIGGFTYNSQTWYLNPIEADSNSDGLIDSVECSPWVASSGDFNPDAACPDTDGDGTPDVWDEDNDGDDVIDSIDASPSNGPTTAYGDDNPLELAISDLTPNKPVFVDLQLRPVNDKQLDYIGSVLDWPSGDTEGQIQRHLSTTFASTDNTEIQSDDDNAANGDIRIIPMLEITMPYSSGHYANLPVKSAYQGVTRSTSMAVGDWLDSDKLDPYAITVRDDETAGQLITYVPLSSVTDPDSGLNTAFTARMLYWPSQSSNGVVTWGSAQQYRVIWMVQMITDSCTDENNLATCTDTLQVIHTYQDEAWRLTGMAVREDHGLDINILYEDPAQDDDLNEEDDLWAASWNLDKIWLRGRDCDSMVNGVCQSNGSRDVTIANMESQIDSWSGNTDAIEVVQWSYDHEDYISSIMMTETLSLLDTSFTNATDETTLLFA
jgi:hypothetical protein